MSSAIHIEVESNDSSLVVTIKDSRVYDEKLVAHVGEEIEELLHSNQKEKVILNFIHVTYLSSSFLGKIIGINKRTKAKSQKLILCGLNDDIMETFQITKLDKFFTFAKTKEEALNI